MIVYTEAEISAICLHHVGNKAEGNDIRFSAEPIAELTEFAQEQIIKFAVGKYKEPKFFSFTSPSGEVTLNPVYQLVSNIFDDPSSLHEESIKIARILFDVSDHPNIKPGDFIMIHLDNLLVEDYMTDAIAIIKSENKDIFLDILGEHIDVKEGIAVEKLDKACLIINNNFEDGYDVLIHDQTNGKIEAEYWSKKFLNIAPRDDSYNATTTYISMTESFIKERLPHIDEADKLTEVEVLKKSKKYLNEAETFDKEEYKKAVFDSDKLQSSFEDFSHDYAQYKNVEIKETFEISDYAVKKKNKVFKSVIKLDKNFHIYVHGDRSKIERGVDENGEKYYKIRYNEEH